MIKDDCTREEAETLAAKGGRVLEWRTIMGEEFATVEVLGELAKPKSEPKKAKPAKRDAAAK